MRMLNITEDELTSQASNLQLEEHQEDGDSQRCLEWDGVHHTQDGTGNFAHNSVAL